MALAAAAAGRPHRPGHDGPAPCPGARSLDGVDLVAVADPAGDPHGAAHGVPVLTSLGALIGKGLDYCVVAVPTALHEQVGQQLAAAGVHVLIEKPVAADQAAATRLVRSFEQAGLVGAVGHIERYNPALQPAAGPVVEPASSATSTRSPPDGRGRSRPGSPTSGWSRTWPPTTST